MSGIITGSDESKKIAEEEVLLFDGQNYPWKTEEECRPVAVRDDLKSVSSLSLFGIDESAIQVRVNTGDSIICFLIDRMTGEYLGPCPH